MKVSQKPLQKWPIILTILSYASKNKHLSIRIDGAWFVFPDGFQLFFRLFKINIKLCLHILRPTYKSSTNLLKYTTRLLNKEGNIRRNNLCFLFCTVWHHKIHKNIQVHLLRIFTWASPLKIATKLLKLFGVLSTTWMKIHICWITANGTWFICFHLGSEPIMVGDIKDFPPYSILICEAVTAFYCPIAIGCFLTVVRTAFEVLNRIPKVIRSRIMLK